MSGNRDSKQKSGADAPALSREERLAQQLRDNLRRRKAQSRALRDGTSSDEKDDG